MTISAGNADVLVPTFQPGDEQHRRRIATWALHINQDIKDFHSSVSAMASTVNALSANAVVVAFCAGNESGQTVSSGAVVTIKSWLTPFFDTANAFNASSGVYTIPSAGFYNIGAHILINSTSWGPPNKVIININKNGVRAAVGWSVIQGTFTDYVYADVNTILSCSVGDTISLSMQFGTGTGVPLYAVSADARNYNQFFINKVK